jgi:hypothetical protein
MSTLLSPSNQVSLHVSGRFKQRAANERLLIEDALYLQLFNHTWNTYKVTPLYHFREEDAHLKYYKNCLDDYVRNEIQNESLWESDDDDEEGRSEEPNRRVTGVQSQWTFKEWPDWSIKLLYIEIQYRKTRRQKSDEAAAPTHICYATLVSTEYEEQQPQESTKHFTRFPLLFVRGSTRLSRVLLDFFESHFDCRMSHFKLQPVELSWLLCEWMPGMIMEKHADTKIMKPLELTLSLPASVSELKHIVVTIPSDSLQRLMKAMEGDVTANDVMDVLESHLKDIFRLNVSRLHLIRVGTSMAYVGGPEAKLKLLDKMPVYGVAVLQTLCQLANHTFRL